MEVLGVAGIDDYLLTPDAVVLLSEVELVDYFLLEEGGVAGVVDLHLAHHLTNDDLEVLVVDLHTLQTIDVLNLVDNVLLNGGRALDGENVVGSDDSIGERCAGAHGVVLLHKDLLGEADEVFLLVAGLGGDDDLAVTALDLTHGDLTIDLGDDCGVARVAGLEELGDTGQTSGDIACLTYGTRNLHEGGTGLDNLAVLDDYVAAYGEVVGSDDVAVDIEDIAGRYA